MKKSRVFQGLCLLSAITLFGQGCFAPKTQETAPTPVAPELNEGSEIQTGVPRALIEYTDEGYIPSTITVSVGTTVTWVNKSSRAMWTASANHPTHNELPGFDSLRSLGSDGLYSYKFTAAGSWGYHNHVTPQHTGTVIVE